MNLHFFRSIVRATLKTKLFPGCFPNAAKVALNTISGAPSIVKHYFKKNFTGLHVLYSIYVAGFENKKTVIYLTRRKPKVQFLSVQKA